MMVSLIYLNRPQTAYTGKIITILWVQLLQAQDQSIFHITDTFDFIWITVASPSAATKSSFLILYL